MPIDTLSLSGAERITDLTGSVWNDVVAGGKIRIIMKEDGDDCYMRIFSKEYSIENGPK